MAQAAGSIGGRGPAAGKRRLLPREHGAYLLWLGATATGVLLAPRPLPALGVGLTVLGAFLARGPLEGHKAALTRREQAWVLGCAALGLLGTMLAVHGAGWHGGWGPLLGAALLAAAMLARREHMQRQPGFEVVAMAALGASVLPMMLAGGAPLLKGIPVALVLATHGGTSVPLVRSEVRPRERKLGGRAVWLAVAALLGCGGGLWVLGAARMLPALMPRMVHLGLRRRLAFAKPSHVGLRETALLGVTVGLLVLGQ